MQLYGGEFPFYIENGDMTLWANIGDRTEMKVYHLDGFVYIAF